MAAELCEYDAANRLQIIKQDGGTPTNIQAFQYGSTNARLMDLDYGYGYLKLFASIGGTTLAEYTEFVGTVPTWTKGYTYFGSSQLGTINPDGSGGEYIDFNHPDRLGTKLKTNQVLGTSSEQNTLPFGTALNAESSLTTNNKRFTSYDRSNATGLDYAINRTYDSKQGRFTQVDPIGMSAASITSPQTLNMYTYCGNDPVNYVDPSGLFFKKLFKWLSKALKIFAIVVMVAAVIMSGPFAPASGSLLAKILGLVLKVATAIGKATNFIAGGLLVSAEAAALGAEVLLTIPVLYGAGMAVGAIANSFAQKEVPPNEISFDDILQRAGELLGNAKCNKLFKKKNGAAILQEKIKDKSLTENGDALVLVPDWRDPTGMSGEWVKLSSRPSIEGATDPDTKVISINPSGTIRNGRGTFPAPYNTLETLDAAASVVIPELLHATNSIKSDGGNPKQSQKNQMKVLKACFPGK